MRGKVTCFSYHGRRSGKLFDVFGPAGRYLGTVRCRHAGAARTLAREVLPDARCHTDQELQIVPTPRTPAERDRIYRRASDPTQTDHRS